MEFSNGEYLVFIKKTVDMPDRINSKKGWLTLNELQKSMVNTNFNIDKFKSKINMNFNNHNFRCKYISN